ncbi:unnamed protein product [Urochloa humidicola]
MNQKSKAKTVEPGGTRTLRPKRRRGDPDGPTTAVRPQEQRRLYLIFDEYPWGIQRPRDDPAAAPLSPPGGRFCFNLRRVAGWRRRFPTPIICFEAPRGYPLNFAAAGKAIVSTHSRRDPSGNGPLWRGVIFGPGQAYYQSTTPQWPNLPPRRRRRRVLPRRLHLQPPLPRAALAAAPGGARRRPGWTPSPRNPRRTGVVGVARPPAAAAVQQVVRRGAHLLRRRRRRRRAAGRHSCVRRRDRRTRSRPRRSPTGSPSCSATRD